MDEKMINQELEGGAAAREGASVEAQEAIAEGTLKEAGEAMQQEEGGQVTAREEINEVDGEPIYHADEGEE